MNGPSGSPAAIGRASHRLLHVHDRGNGVVGGSDLRERSVEQFVGRHLAVRDQLGQAQAVVLHVLVEPHRTHRGMEAPCK